MSISMYSASVPPFLRMLDNLAGILEKGQAFANARAIDPSVLLNSRLFPDMRPLSAQIQMACDSAAGAAARLAGVDVPSFPGPDTSFAEMFERIRKAREFLKSLTPQQIDGSENHTIKLVFPGATLEYKGLDYLLHFALPNFYFHVTTAYDILRHNGVEIGKRDFLSR